jgi:hypothetical protein
MRGCRPADGVDLALTFGTLLSSQGAVASRLGSLDRRRGASFILARRADPCQIDRVWPSGSFGSPFLLL